jgi:hypothetical protein
MAIGVEPTDPFVGFKLVDGVFEVLVERVLA